jgi:hypothetical protein
MEYKVLLIDDKHDHPSIETIKKMAAMANIELIGEKYHVQGMELLKKDTSLSFQAVILDATGYKKSELEEGKESNSGLYYSLKFLNELKADRMIPWFVYTGAPRNLDDENFMDQISEYQNEIKFGRSELCYYTKTIHEKELLQDLKAEIDNIQQTQIQHQHKEVFQIAKNINIPDEDINHLVAILKSIQSNGSDLEPSLYFTQLRKYVEYVFRAAAKYNILHENCIDKNGKINLAESSLFLAGENTKHLKVACSKAHFPKIMAENIKNLIFVTGAASHTSDVDPTKNMDYQHYREQLKTPYLLYQLTFIICDLFVWFDNYLSKNREAEWNKNYWISLEEIASITLDTDWTEGVFSEIQPNGYGTFKPNDGSNSIGIHPIAITKFEIFPGEKLKVKTQPSPDGSKIYIKEIIKLL